MEGGGAWPGALIRPRFGTICFKKRLFPPSLYRYIPFVLKPSMIYRAVLVCEIEAKLRIKAADFQLKVTQQPVHSFDQHLRILQWLPSWYVFIYFTLF